MTKLYRTRPGAPRHPGFCSLFPESQAQLQSLLELVGRCAAFAWVDTALENPLIKHSSVAKWRRCIKPQSHKGLATVKNPGYWSRILVSTPLFVLPGRVSSTWNFENHDQPRTPYIHALTSGPLMNGPGRQPVVVFDNMGGLYPKMEGYAVSVSSPDFAGAGGPGRLVMV
ncbi:hypothetical protein MYCTH_2107078 [Thermothelomyces thermophilus ATCC 42464]|uniref:Uncharacterized protein n=1 Tax=Thermothelomyces thermophilus (strain ATCC 42464 / BCRC 31852 / DSM 1799) TaxID=573729 RepID=G2Q2W7_THET4|nr:uncharacterized protein MYCTH_2107078 [Thermothelomyces thermophilus ATCC 42464]AEO54334.1 hypothetical protein MYCTH_2107078 [Thermothelomyces thermophilus ATCC 42464]